MTITKNNNCTEIYITQELFAGFEESTNDVTSITLFYKVNGAVEEEYSVQISDINAGILTLDMNFFSQTTESLLEGVYCFRLLIEINDGESEITEYGNILIDCSLLCNLASYTWNNPTKFLYSKYEAIKYYQGCNACDCTTVYSLYQDLANDLDSTVNTDCQC